MKKKTIKYLIWTILLTIMIIIPTIKVNADTGSLTYETFSKSKDLFCLDRGKRFTSIENYESRPFTADDIDERFDTNYGKDENVLKYIITRRKDFGDKASIDDFIPQQAIWLLQYREWRLFGE